MITSRVASSLIVGSTEPFTVGDLQSQFEEVHGSVNAPAPAGHLTGALLQIEQPTQGVLSLMPELLLMIVGQRDEIVPSSQAESARSTPLSSTQAHADRSRTMRLLVGSALREEEE